MDQLVEVDAVEMGSNVAPSHNLACTHYMTAVDVVVVAVAGTVVVAPASVAVAVVVAVAVAAVAVSDSIASHWFVDMTVEALRFALKRSFLDKWVAFHLAAAAADIVVAASSGSSSALETSVDLQTLPVPLPLYRTYSLFRLRCC